MEKFPINLILAVSLLLVQACGYQGDTERQGFTPPLPADTVTLESSLTFGPLERLPGEMVMDFAAIMEVPSELTVEQGNSGVGWASLRVGSRKFCYQGNAISERTGGGSLYFLRYEQDVFAISCATGGEIAFDPEVIVEEGSLIRLMIEDPGCSVEAGACSLIRVRATLPVLDTFPFERSTP